MEYVCTDCGTTVEVQISNKLNAQGYCSAGTSTEHDWEPVSDQ